MIAEVQEYEYEVVKKEIEELIQLSYEYDDMKTVRKMKEIVPEFHSLNSPYEELDHTDKPTATTSHAQSGVSKPASATPQSSNAAPSAAYTSQAAAKNPTLLNLDETEPAESIAHPDKDDIFLVNKPDNSNKPNKPNNPHSSDP